MEGETVNLDTHFQRGEIVYAKIFARYSWKWVLARVTKVLGSLVFEVEMDDHRVHRRHLNQLRKRDSLNVLGLSDSARQSTLPLDLHTDSWKDCSRNDPA